MKNLTDFNIISLDQLIDIYYYLLNLYNYLAVAKSN